MCSFDERMLILVAERERGSAGSLYITVSLTLYNSLCLSLYYIKNNTLMSFYGFKVQALIESKVTF